MAEAMALGEAMEVPGTLGQAIMVAEATAVVVEPTREVDSLLEAMEGVVVMAEDTLRAVRVLDIAGVWKSSCIRVGLLLSIFIRLSTSTTATLRYWWRLLG